MAKTMQVLVIDDEDMIRDIIKAVLTDAGYQVAAAANGAEGLKRLHAQHFDLVITDILMPEKEGVETIIEIKKTRPETKIIAISGGGRANNLYPLKIAEKIGADKTLPKPFEPEELLKVVREVISAPPGQTQVRERAT
jgi:CheY-like chemotaxis protein